MNNLPFSIHIKKDKQDGFIIIEMTYKVTNETRTKILPFNSPESDVNSALAQLSREFFRNDA